MILVWKFLRTSVSRWCTNVEVNMSSAPLQIPLSSNQGLSLWRSFTHTSLLPLFPPHRWSFSKMCSTGRVWQSFLPAVHSPTPRHAPGPSPSKVLCLNPWGVSAEFKHFCLPYAPEAELCWTPSSSRPKSITQTQPWDLLRPFLFLLCKSAILIEALGPPPCPPSHLVTSSLLRAEEYRQSLPRPTFLLCQPPHHTQQPGLSLPQGSCCTSCSFLETATGFPCESITSSSSSSDHLCQSHHGLLIHSGEAHHEGTQEIASCSQQEDHDALSYENRQSKWQDFKSILWKGIPQVNYICESFPLQQYRPVSLIYLHKRWLSYSMQVISLAQTGIL